MKIISLLLAFIGSAHAQFKIVSTDTSVKITNGDQVVTEYRTDSKVPYLYPISAPAGSNLSRHWPMENDAASEEQDHPHHRSFWLSHGKVNDYDFWAWTGNKDARIVHRSTEKTATTEKSASFTVNLDWVAEKKTLLTEMRSYVIEDIDAETRVIDTTTTLKAANGDVVFGDTKEGFFALRVDRSLRLKGPEAKGIINDSHGRKNEACWGKKSAWVAFSGPDEQGKPAVIVMMDHPQNLRHETTWHARDYGLLAANPFGIHDFEGKKDNTLGNYTLKDQQSITFRYRLVLHRGAYDDKKIQDWWKGYSK